MFECRMLTNDDFTDVVKTMQSGFSDYFIDINIDAKGYRRKFALEGVDLAHSGAVFDDGKMIGVTVNGVSDWHGAKTVYDAGTAVIPEYRGKGASTRMFECMLPELKNRGFERYLLEVIVENEPALGLYQKLGFARCRELGVYKLKKPSDVAPDYADPQIRTLNLNEIIDSELFSDSGLTWQNSNDWMRRAESIGYRVDIVGAEIDGEVAGIGAVSPSSGKVQRIAVDEKHRGNGIGRRILKELANRSEKDLMIVNVDLVEKDAIGFLSACGCEKTIEQFEMELAFV